MLAYLRGGKTWTPRRNTAPRNWAPLSFGVFLASVIKQWQMTMDGGVPQNSCHIQLRAMNKTGPLTKSTSVLVCVLLWGGQASPSSDKTATHAAVTLICVLAVVYTYCSSFLFQIFLTWIAAATSFHHDLICLSCCASFSRKGRWLVMQPCKMLGEGVHILR